MGETEGGGASRSTDPASGTSAATDVSLREFLAQAIDASRRECREGIKNLEQHMRVQDAAAREAIAKALESIDKRFDSVNEFRASLSDLSNRMATQDALRGLADKVEASNEALEARFDGFYQHNRDAILALSKRVDLREGQEAGSRLTKGALYTAIGASVALIGLLIVVANILTGR